MAEKFHADTATQRAKARGKEPYPQTTLLRPNRSRAYGSTTRSGAPMRSIKESLVNRGPGERAAQSYLNPSTSKPSIFNTRTSPRLSGGNRRAGDVISYTPKSARSGSGYKYLTQ